MSYSAHAGAVSRTQAHVALGPTGSDMGSQPQVFGAVALSLPQQWKADGQVSPLGDAKLAAVFRQIRAILGLDEIAMARRLGTGIDVVLGLETGSVDTLPSWPETARVVERYAELGGVDPAPILSRLLHLQTIPVVPPPRPPSPPADLQYNPHNPPRYEPMNDLADALLRQSQMARTLVPQPSAYSAPHTTIDLQAETVPTVVSARDRAKALPPPVAHDGPAAEPTTVTPIGFAARTRLEGEVTTERTRPPTRSEANPDQTVTAARRRRRIRNTAIALSPLALLFVLFIGSYAAPRASYAIANSLPGPLGSATRGLVDVMVAQTATFKDGLRWIEVSDPRIRKASRLDTR